MDRYRSPFNMNHNTNLNQNSGAKGTNKLLNSVW